jgi:hypothetical protein
LTNGRFATTENRVVGRLQRSTSASTIVTCCRADSRPSSPTSLASRSNATTSAPRQCTGDRVFAADVDDEVAGLGPGLPHERAREPATAERVLSGRTR